VRVVTGAQARSSSSCDSHALPVCSCHGTGSGRAERRIFFCRSFLRQDLVSAHSADSQRGISACIRGHSAPHSDIAGSGLVDQILKLSGLLWQSAFAQTSGCPFKLHRNATWRPAWTAGDVDLTGALAGKTEGRVMAGEQQAVSL